MIALPRVLKDPLVHFLLGGALIFAASALVGGGKSLDDDHVIQVDRATLLKYLQYQSAAFQPDYFAAQFDAMSPAEREALVDRYVREEALVRQARGMELDRVDYVIRQRLVQKMLFLLDDMATAAEAPGEAELRAYYQAHEDAYRGAPTMTFTHVFIDNEVAHQEGNDVAARRLLAELQQRKAGFNDAPGFGDRMPFLQNYIDRTPDFVANQYGPDFSTAVSRLEPSSNWQGPIRSAYGWHLVLVTDKKPARLAPFEDVRGQVKDDMLADHLAGFRDKAIADLVKQYDVRTVDLDAPTPVRK